MLGQGPAVSVAARAALCPRVVRTFERGPEHDLRFRIAPALPFDAGFQRTEGQGPDVLGEMKGVRVVCSVRCDSVRVVIYTRDYLRALPATEASTFHARRGSPSAAK